MNYIGSSDSELLNSQLLNRRSRFYKIIPYERTIEIRGFNYKYLLYFAKSKYRVTKHYGQPTMIYTIQYKSNFRFKVLQNYRIEL